MASVEPGTFQMGSNEDLKDSPDEGPVHTVTLTQSYEIGTTEVTNEHFLTVMNWAKEAGKIWILNIPGLTLKDRYKQGEFPLFFYWQHVGTLPEFGKTLFRYISAQEGVGTMVVDVRETGGKLIPLQGREKLPAAMVSWYGAAAFCNFLGEIRGLKPLYDPSSWKADFETPGYRLPTEAEWVWAYKGGKKSNGYKYSGSDNPTEVAWSGEINDRPRENRAPVGSMKPNELGVYDMMGNVWEWTNDWAGPFPVEDVIDPKGPPERLIGKQDWIDHSVDYDGNHIEVWKVKKGGEWQTNAYGLGPEERSFFYPPDEVNFDYPLMGFRVVKQMAP